MMVGDGLHQAEMEVCDSMQEASVDIMNGAE
jgi:hypothetical protein